MGEDACSLKGSEQGGGPIQTRSVRRYQLLSPGSVRLWLGSCGDFDFASGPHSAPQGGRRSRRQQCYDGAVFGEAEAARGCCVRDTFRMFAAPPLSGVVPPPMSHRPIRQRHAETASSTLTACGRYTIQLSQERASLARFIGTWVARTSLPPWRSK